MIADKAYDSDPLRKRLRQRGSELICAQKESRSSGDVGWPRLAALSPPLGRGAHHWLVGEYRRLVVRYDRSLQIYRALSPAS